MKKGSRPADVEALLGEIRRYRSYVEACRAKPPAPPEGRRRGSGPGSGWAAGRERDADELHRPER
jgi:hypothetical protein